MNVIIDLEHTISNANHRIEMKKTGVVKKVFQEEFKNDKPNNDVIIFMRQLKSAGHFLIILSAKQVEYEEMVLNWLRLHDVPFDSLNMKYNEFIDSVYFKSMFIKQYPEKIDFALDDVGKNCAMFAKHGIPSLRITQK